jgi:hypothetical protein
MRAGPSLFLKMPDYDEPLLIESVHADDQAPSLAGVEGTEAADAVEASEASVSGQAEGSAAEGFLPSTKDIRTRFHAEMDADEAGVEDQTARIDEKVGNIPVLSQLVKGAAWADEEQTKFRDGGLRAAVDMGTGMIDQEQRQIDTELSPPSLEGVEQTAKNMAKDFDKPLDLRLAGQDPNIGGNALMNTSAGKAWQQGKYADALGQGAFQVGSFFMGGEVEEAGELPEVLPHPEPESFAPPDAAPDTEIPDTEPVPDTERDPVPDEPAPRAPEAPETQRSPVGRPRAPTPDPEVPEIDPPSYQPDSLPPTVPNRLLPGAPAPTPEIVPDIDAPPDTVPTDGPAVEPSPDTLPSASDPPPAGPPFDPDHVPRPGERAPWPPRGGASNPWGNRPVESPTLDRGRSEFGYYLSPEGTPLEQRALTPEYDEDAAEQMGLPPDADVGPHEYGVYGVKPGTNLFQSTVAPAYGKPGGSTQYFTGVDPENGIGPNLLDQTGDPIVRPDGTTVQPKIGPNGEEIPVPAVDRTGGPLSYQYGHSWKVEDIDPAERDAIEALEREQQ